MRMVVIIAFAAGNYSMLRFATFKTAVSCSG
jgi:hypothetical protein